MSSKIPLTSIRIPSDLKEWFRSNSSSAERTMTGEIIFALREYAASRGFNGRPPARTGGGPRKPLHQQLQQQ